MFNKELKKNFLYKKFIYKNIHHLKKNFSKVTLFLTIKESSINLLIKVMAALELITYQRPFVLRIKKSSIFYKKKKGEPIGVKITLRKKKLNFFFFKLIWLLFPNIKLHLLKKNLKIIKDKKFQSLILNIPSLLEFKETQRFYFFFRNINNLKIFFTFEKNFSRCEKIFFMHFLKFPL